MSFTEVLFPRVKSRLTAEISYIRKESVDTKVLSLTYVTLTSYSGLNVTRLINHYYSSFGLR